MIRKRFLPADRPAWSRLFPRNRNDLGGARAPYCYLAAFVIWIPLAAAVATLTLPGGLVLGVAWGAWLFLGWRRSGGTINERRGRHRPSGDDGMT